MLKSSSEKLWKKLNEMEAHNEIRKLQEAREEKFCATKFIDEINFHAFLFFLRQKSFSTLESKSRSYCKSHQEPLEVNSVQWRWNSYNLRYLGSQLFWGWRSKWNVCKSLVSRSISHVSWLCSKHKSYRWSDNSWAHSALYKAIEERRCHKLVICLHSSGCNQSFSHSLLHVNAQNYKSSLQGTLKRRQHLNEAKFFWCICERCKSNDELSTHASTLLCPKCTYGFVLPVNTLDENSEWR